MACSPMHIKPKLVDTISSQIDVAPTPLSLLNMTYVSNFFGKDILSMRKEEGRVFIGNYQHLGLYKEGKLSVLSPRKLMVSQIYPGNVVTSSFNLYKPDEDMKEAIAFYEGASYIFEHKLNAWDSERVVLN